MELWCNIDLLDRYKGLETNKCRPLSNPARSSDSFCRQAPTGPFLFSLFLFTLQRAAYHMQCLLYCCNNNSDVSLAGHMGPPDGSFGITLPHSIATYASVGRWPFRAMYICVRLPGSECMGLHQTHGQTHVYFSLHGYDFSSRWT